MKSWKEENTNTLNQIKEYYGFNNLNTPLFQLQEFIYKGEPFQNKKMRILSKFLNNDIFIEKYDRLSGCFDGSRMHCFYRTFLNNELSYEFESLLKKYDILYEKYILNDINCYACDIARLDLNNLEEINNYSFNNYSLKENIIYNTTQLLSKKIL